MVGDNAETQTGQLKGLVKMNSKLFNKQMFVVGCYPHVLNITVRRCCQVAFGSNPHIQQLHYKIAWLHHEKPNFYQSMYTILELLDKEPPLPQMWVETRWEYNHLQWYAQYESPCLSLAKKMIAHLSSSDSHLSIWKNVIKWSSSSLI